MIPHSVFILRHGETEWNAAGRLQGHLDSALTPLGLQQAIMQREILEACDLRGAVAFSSPQRRAIRTAEIALEGLLSPTRQDARLREIGLGDWAGTTRADLPAMEGVTDPFALYEHAPGGEGFARLHMRCLGFLQKLTGPSVIVTHGITSRMLRLVLTGRPIADLPQMEGGQGVVFRLENGKQTRLAKKA